MNPAGGRVAVVGAGYAGLAAAVELAAAGRTVEVFEASRTLGGRARAIELEGLTLDNGAHILVGAYRETLRLMRQVGADPDRLLARHPLHLEFPGEARIGVPPGLTFLPGRLPLAAALLGARGLGLADKWAALTFLRAIESQDFRLAHDQPVAELLARHRQPARLTRYLWEPLCLAALNTPPGRASAQVFLNVLRDSLAAGRDAADLLLPRTDFSRLFPEPAAAFVAARGGTIRRASRVERVVRLPAGPGLVVAGRTELFDALVVAVAPYHLPALVGGLDGLEAAAALVGGYAWEPIVTVYLGYPAHVGLPFPMLGATRGPGQWLFDRGRLCGQRGVIAAVISAGGPHEALAGDELAAQVAAQVRALLPTVPAPHWHRVIAEKRATFACLPDLARPAVRTSVPGIVLAGDYVAGDYPATLEGAVRSGIAAAHALLA